MSSTISLIPNKDTSPSYNPLLTSLWFYAAKKSNGPKFKSEKSTQIQQAWKKIKSTFNEKDNFYTRETCIYLNLATDSQENCWSAYSFPCENSIELTTIKFGKNSTGPELKNYSRIEAIALSVWCCPATHGSHPHCLYKAQWPVVSHGIKGIISFTYESYDLLYRHKCHILTRYGFLVTAKVIKLLNWYLVPWMAILQNPETKTLLFTSLCDCLCINISNGLKWAHGRH